MTATFAVPDAYCEGHFPGRPILPALALLALIIEQLARESQRPLLLRTIPFLRLRQLVAPGDRLTLAARRRDDECVNVEVRRDGAVVANGALGLGPPAAPAGTPAHRTAGAGRGVPIGNLLPQQPPMRFVTSIIGELPEGLVCEARIPAACALVVGGSAPAFAAVEAAAQTAALWEAVRRARESSGESSGAGPRVGYLVALRDLALFAERIPADAPLVASARLDGAALPLTHYAIEVGREGVPVLRGKIATYLADEAPPDREARVRGA
jgi:predicted hotdog family 3-hydroxylacyl-ACP dehydratase